MIWLFGYRQSLSGDVGLFGLLVVLFFLGKGFSGYYFINRNIRINELLG